MDEEKNESGDVDIKEEVKNNESSGYHKSVENASSSNSSLTDKMRENPWIASTLVFGVLFLIVVAGNFQGGVNGNVISENAAGEIILDFVKSQTDGQGELVGVKDLDSNFYEVGVLFQGQEIPLYITKDGKNFVQGLTPVDALSDVSNDDGQGSQNVEIVKSDKPKVELFVMTHCTYGTQAEKGFLPTIVALGDKIDSSIKFVHYFLHAPEETETPIQICIREEQGTKFNAYLKEFLVEGDSETALVKAGVDKTKLDACIVNRYDSLYATDSALSEGYGVRGSPTLVINGQIANSGRSADAYLKIICSAFNEVPDECLTLELDSANPSPGFGYGTSSSVANAQC